MFGRLPTMVSRARAISLLLFLCSFLWVVLGCYKMLSDAFLSQRITVLPSQSTLYMRCHFNLAQTGIEILAKHFLHNKMGVSWKGGNGNAHAVAEEN